MVSKARAFDPATGQGFWLAFTPSPGMGERAERHLMRDLEDHLAQVGLRIDGGTQRHLYIRGTERELTLADQIDLVDWLLLRTTVARIDVTEFTDDATRIPVTSKVMRVGRWDLATLGVGLLYRIGRIKPELYAEILGGFVDEPNRELFA
ncbi:hypothetical protein [Inhella proteolytica]|uniref:Uncharacterized protein n=1 Tax=Inhella proteolytica TaxID=2795029 RepID=A0A931J4N4_9BURK|nr:hypothetical protein [Inhella proteolytica]MBH9578155.1 hypothetical protein [Inhella proteolytica]